jgi:hypothetical protein
MANVIDLWNDSGTSLAVMPGVGGQTMKPDSLGSNPASVFYDLTLPVSLSKLLPCCVHFLICKMGIKLSYSRGCCEGQTLCTS